MENRNRFFLAMFLFCCVFFSVAGTAHSITIYYDALDLDNVDPAKNLWQYTYYVSGDAFDVNDGFTIYFDPALYADLQETPPGVSGWDILVMQPDNIVNYPVTGYYDALAQVDNSSLLYSFSISFVWIGTTGAPSAQHFENYHYDDAGLTILGDGATTPIPEPATLTLFGIGAVGAGFWKVRSRRD
jgi:hypothetical protein